MKHLLFPIFLAAITAQASVTELTPNLASDDLTVRHQAQADLLREASHAGRPGAEAERAAYCRDLCEALSNNPPPHAAAQLIRQLQRIGGQESVDTLRGLLSHPDPNLRDDVRQALEANPAPNAGEALLEAWKQSDNESWTIGLMNSLALRGDHRAVKPLIHALKDSNPRIAAAAYASLGKMRQESAATALYRALQATEGAARVQNARALLDYAHLAARHDNRGMAARLYHSLTGQQEPADIRTSAWIGLLTALPDQAAKRAEPLSDPVILAAAIEASTQIEHPELIDKIAEQLGSTPPAFQLRILAALETHGETKHASVVVPLLASDDATIAGAAAQTLGTIGSAEDVPALMDAGAEDALARLPGADEALRMVAVKGSPEQRVLAIEILGRRAEKGLNSQLLSYARDPDDKVAAAALAALEDIATIDDLDAIATLMLAAESSSVARTALGTIIAINRNTSQPELGADLLVNKLTSASARGQALLFQAFVKIGSDTTLQPVLNAIESDQPTLRAAGLKALGSWPESNAVEPLLKFAGDETMDLTDHVLLMRGLSRILSDSKRVNLSQCEKALQAARRPEEQKMFLGMLGKSKDKAALALIEPYLADPDLMEEAKLAAEAVRAGKR